jgi:hypothetical protein
MATETWWPPPRESPVDGISVDGTWVTERHPSVVHSHLVYEVPNIQGGECQAWFITAKVRPESHGPVRRCGGCGQELCDEHLQAHLRIFEAPRDAWSGVLARYDVEAKRAKAARERGGTHAWRIARPEREMRARR